MQTNKGSNTGIIFMIAETLGIPWAIHITPTLESIMAPDARRYENASREETLNWLATSIDSLPTIEEWNLALKPMLDAIEMNYLHAAIKIYGLH